MPSQGRFQIKRISPVGSSSPTYQISHERYQGGEFVGSVEAEHLEEFLRDRLRLTVETVHEIMEELGRKDRVIVANVELPESDLASAGMQYLAPDV